MSDNENNADTESKILTVLKKIEYNTWWYCSQTG